MTPSTKTYQDIFAKASKFAAENKTEAQFNKAVEAEGLNKRTAPSLREMSNRIAGIENPRQIIRWAFDEETEVGDVSTIFELDNSFVIALLTKKTEKGIPALADIKETIKPQVLNRKKGEYVLEKMNAAGQDLNRIASDLKSQVENADLAFDSRMLLNFGQESKVIGKIFTLGSGGFSTIAGSTAAFAVKVNNLNIAALPTQLDQVSNEGRNSFESSVRNNAYFRALEKFRTSKTTGNCSTKNICNQTKERLFQKSSLFCDINGVSMVRVLRAMCGVGEILIYLAISQNDTFRKPLKIKRCTKCRRQPKPSKKLMCRFVYLLMLTRFKMTDGKGAWLQRLSEAFSSWLTPALSH